MMRPLNLKLFCGVKNSTEPMTISFSLSLFVPLMSWCKRMCTHLCGYSLYYPFVANLLVEYYLPDFCGPPL